MQKTRLALSPTPSKRVRNTVIFVAVTSAGMIHILSGKGYENTTKNMVGRQGSELVVATTPTASTTGNGAPFVLSERRHANGVVTAVETAGSYAYVTVRTADGGVIVTATLGNGPRIGAVVDLTLFGRRDVFVSRRLGKTFAPLDFGIVSSRG